MVPPLTLVVPDIRKVLLEGAWSVALVISHASISPHRADQDQFPSFGMDSVTPLMSLYGYLTSLPVCSQWVGHDLETLETWSPCSKDWTP